MPKKNRVIALCGAGRGPLISTREFPIPLVRVHCLNTGDKVLVHSGKDVVELLENGDHPVPAADQMRLECPGDSKNLLCFIVQG